MKLNKKGSVMGFVAEHLQMIILLVAWLILTLLIFKAYSDNNVVLEITSVKDAAISAEVLQAGNGALIYQVLGYANGTYLLRDNYVYFMKEKPKYSAAESKESSGAAQDNQGTLSAESKSADAGSGGILGVNIFSSFIKDKSSELIESWAFNEVTFSRNGNQVLFSSSSPNEKSKLSERVMLGCPAALNSKSMTEIALAIDPAHGGLDDSSLKSAAGNAEEGQITFFIADFLNKSYGTYFKDKKIILTRENKDQFADFLQRKSAAENADVLITIHIGSEINKNTLNVFVPNDANNAANAARNYESAALGCLIANEFPADYQISYPKDAADSLQGKDMLAFGKDAAVYLEIGSIDDSFNIVEISNSIYRALKKYTKEK